MANGELARLADDYFQERMRALPFDATVFGAPGHDAEVPDPSRRADAERVAALDRWRARLDAIPADGLADSEQVTRSMLERALRDDRDQAIHALGEFSVSGSTVGVLSEVLAAVPTAALGDGAAAEAYLARLGRLGGYFDAVLARNREAAADGRAPTARGARQAIAQVEDYLAAGPADPLLRPESPAAVDATVWRAEAARLLDEAVRPALRRYRDGLAELAESGRGDEQAGVCHVPGGAAGYLSAGRAHTTTDLTPDEIHQLGLNLVAELRAEFAEVGGRAFGTGDVPEVLRRLREDPALRFESAAQIVETATAALRRAEDALPDWFRDYPTAPCEVREMHPSEAKGGVLGYYMPPAGDGSRGGAHVVNTHEPASRPRFESEALSFHESVPGHHTQVAVAQTLADLPDFRRYGFVTAHGEGWGLYAERLADEMGLYTSDLTRLGMISFDAWRACRLVVDTGMHYLGWPRAKAVEFMRDNTALSDSNIANEVDRYIAWPGQALAYMVGRIRIGQARERARAALGAGFDIRGFHHQVLGHGPLPLDTLDEIVARWVSAAR